MFYLGVAGGGVVFAPFASNILTPLIKKVPVKTDAYIADVWQK